VIHGLVIAGRLCIPVPGELRGVWTQAVAEQLRAGRPVNWRENNREQPFVAPRLI